MSVRCRVIVTIASAAAMLAAPATGRADPDPPEARLGDSLRTYRVASAKGTIVQTWERAIPDAPCDPPACNPASTRCTAMPMLCVQRATQTYKFGLDAPEVAIPRTAYVITRRRSKKTLGAILFPVKAYEYAEQVGWNACVRTKDVANTFNPMYFSIVRIGKQMRIRLERTVFNEVTCIQAPAKDAMAKAGFVPTLRVSRARFKRSRVTLKFASAVPFVLGDYHGTVSSTITIKLKSGHRGA